MRRTHGTWVAWGSGTADRDMADELGRVAVPPDEACYTLRRVWLDDADINGYYHGFANRALWPLCHMLIQHFEYRTEYWERYRTVNLRFAHAVADEAERSSGVQPARSRRDAVRDGDQRKVRHAGLDADRAHQRERRRGPARRGLSSGRPVYR